MITFIKEFGYACCCIYFCTYNAIGALCIWLSSVNTDSTIVRTYIILYLMSIYNITEIEQYMCTMARNRYCEFIMNFNFNDYITIACKEHHCQHSGLSPDSGKYM